MKTVELKKGSTLSIAGFVKLPVGTWSASAKVAKPNGELIGPLDVTLSPLGTPGTKGETHSIAIYKSATDTALWTVGNLLCDIRFADTSNMVIHSPTFTITVLQQITNA